jgi:hypothetical protein
MEEIILIMETWKTESITIRLRWPGKLHRAQHLKMDLMLQQTIFFSFLFHSIS